MPEFTLIDIEEMPYLYVERTCTVDAIAQNMGSAFQTVMEFIQKNGIKPTGEALSVYYDYDLAPVSFRAGFAVLATDAAKAEGDILAATTPAGRVLKFTHIGPYQEMEKSYDAMMQHLQDNNMEMGFPTWEVYLNDPSTVSPEELRTEVFVSLVQS